MSKNYLKRNNIKEVREMKDGVIFIIDNACHEWVLKGTTLFHMDNRRCDGKAQYHRQREVDNIYHAIKYISNHTKKYLSKPKTSRMEYLFSLI